MKGKQQKDMVRHEGDEQEGKAKETNQTPSNVNMIEVLFFILIMFLS